MTFIEGLGQYEWCLLFVVRFFQIHRHFKYVPFSIYASTRETLQTFQVWQWFVPKFFVCLRQPLIF